MKVVETEKGFRIIIEDAHEVHVHVERSGALVECHWAGEMSDRQLKQLRVALLHRGFNAMMLHGTVRL